MIDKLLEAERLLPEMLKDESAWIGVYADSERPVLSRLWRQWGENRIYLHAFDPCEAHEAFAHKHPWKFAIRIVDGIYEMTVGATSDPMIVLPVAARMIFTAGSVYEMCDEDAFHAARPIGGRSHSLMVAGPKLWDKNRVRANKIVRALTPPERARLFAFFRDAYPLH